MGWMPASVNDATNSGQKLEDCQYKSLHLEHFLWCWLPIIVMQQN